MMETNTEGDDIWSYSLKPRNVKVFGVPNERQVVHVEIQTLPESNVELLTELSPTPTGKFFIVVFQRKLLPFKKGPSPVAINRKKPSIIQELNRYNKGLERRQKWNQE